jgi:hypothetical protein
MSELSDDPRREPPEEEHNRLGFRNVDEESEYDERGSQTEGPGEPPPEEGDAT